MLLQTALVVSGLRAREPYTNKLVAHNFVTGSDVTDSSCFRRVTRR
jgi:hypothetical protein